MHRTKAFVLAAVLIVPPGIIFAQEIPADNIPSAPPAAVESGEQGKETMAVPPGMRGMRGMMMGAKPPQSMVATSDGGVVVMAGHKIMKYDKDLNLIKEVEFKSPSDTPPAPGASN